MAKKLTRKSSGKVLAGVCAGIGDYFGIDPIIIRILFLFLTFCAGGGVIAYLICLLLMPKN